MKTITIKTNDKDKADAITLLLKNIEGISLHVSDDKPEFIPPEITPRNPKANPRNLAGIWKGSRVNIDSIRKKAWRKRQTI